MKIAVAGPRGYGSMRIRGNTLAEAHGWDLLDCRKQPPGRYDVIWLVKRGQGQTPEDLRPFRDAADRLICDPLDFWASPTSADPFDCWAELYDVLRFDDLVATSRTSRSAMEAGLLRRPRSLITPAVRIHVLPHAADHRVDRSFHDPAGAVVYAGSRCFLGGWEDRFREACGMLGREFRTDFSQHHAWKSLRGAALQICVRDRRHACRWNQYHRPQIKIANSAAAGIPVIITGHPVEREFAPWSNCIGGDPGADALAEIIDGSLIWSAQPLTGYNRDQYFADALRVVQC